MEGILSTNQVNLLAKLLVASGRVSTTTDRKALLIEVGYLTDQLPIDGIGSKSFAFILVDRLNQAGDRETLQRLVGTISPNLRGRQAELLKLWNALGMTLPLVRDTELPVSSPEDQHGMPAEVVGEILDETDRAEIAKEIAEEMQAEREGQHGMPAEVVGEILDETDRAEIAKEIAEEMKEPDESLLSSPRSSSQTARSSGIGEWLITRISGILDEITASLILTGILYIFGRLFGYLSGTPVTWLRKSSAIWYLITSVTVITMAIIAYIIWQRKRR